MTQLLKLIAIAVAASAPLSAAEVHDAAGAGDVERVRALVAADPALREAADDQGRTPLHWAIMREQPELWSLLRTEANLAAPDAMGITPIFLAITNSSPAALAWLLAEGADVASVKPSDGQTPLHWAAEQGRGEAVRLLLDHGASTSARNLAGSTPLHLAAKLGAMEVAAALLAAGADPDAGNVVGITPLMLAAGRDRPEMVELILDANADASLRDLRGKTARDYAVAAGHTAVVELFGGALPENE